MFPSKLTACLATAAVVAGVAAPSAMAQDTSVLNRQNRGFYIGGGVGANFLEDNKFERNGTDSTATYEPGLAGILNFGYALGNGLRLELEPGYRYNDVDKINGASAGGRLQTASILANVIYDFDIHTPIVPLVPHIGAGIGYARVWNRSLNNGISVNNNDDTLAFQAIAGVDYAISPGVKIGLDYRYFVAHDADFRAGEIPAGATGGATSHVGDINNHTVMLTFRYEFGRPAARPAPPPEPAAYVPPPPPPEPPAAVVPPPAPATQNYTVYFDFNRADIPASARPVITQAAQSAKQGNATRINVTGYTDTVGSDRYNQRLSERRAEAVRQALVREGVPANEIVTVGRGKQDLAVPTAEGVREPRNRRVEIVLGGPGA